MLLPAGGLFEILDRCTLPATEQVEACLLFGLFAACRCWRDATLLLLTAIAAIGAAIAVWPVIRGGG